MLGIASPFAFLSAADAAAPATHAAGASTILPPLVILVMCLVAGLGTVMLLPSRRESPIRKIGGVVVLAAALIFAALLVRYAGRSEAGGMGVYFWVFSAISLAGALRVVTHARPVYSALYFVLTVFATAGLFILLWAEFMAVALVLIYAGAILVTYVFVIMLATSSDPAPGTGAADDADGDTSGNGAARGTPGGALGAMAEHDAVSREPLVASAIGFTLMGILLFVIFDRANETIPPRHRTPGTLAVIEEGILATGPKVGETQRLGVYLFQNHLVNLELAGLLLTVSMVGAIVIARRRVYVAPEPATAGRPGAARRDVFTAPMTPVDDNPHSIPVYGTDNPRQKAYPET
jgi:NADH-quinone oxidoreductase subunit J